MTPSVMATTSRANWSSRWGVTEEEADRHRDETTTTGRSPGNEMTWEGYMADADGQSIHTPVQVEEVLRLLAPESGGTYLDLTVGAGGHARAILEREPGARVIGVDQDAEILEFAAERLRHFGERAVLVNSRFDDIRDLLGNLGQPMVNGILLDLGVSSLQLDNPERGFSFDEDGPLDMRMDPRRGKSAAEFVNQGTEAELLHAIGVFGGEARARSIVTEIVRERSRAPMRRTCELSDLVKRCVRGKRHHHPATRTFLGLRIAVNDELGVLERALSEALNCLQVGGRAVVISFHGGEDRLVKNAFRSAEDGGHYQLLTDGPVTPDSREVQTNPRSRSSRIRAVECLSHRSHSGDDV